MNIGGGDYIEIEICLDCGQTQGHFPIPETPMEQEYKESLNDPFKINDFVDFSRDGMLWVGEVERYDRENEEVWVRPHGRVLNGKVIQDYQRLFEMKSYKLDVSKVKTTEYEW